MAVSSAELKVVLSAVDNMSAELKKVQSSLGNLDQSAGASGKTLEGLGKTISGLTMGAAVAGVAAFAGGLAATVKSASDFEHAISGISAVSGATADELEGIRQTALKLGADTSFSATEAAKGMEELVKAGISLADVMGGAGRASLDLAAAGEVSVSEAATIASNAMNAFGLSGKDMTHVADEIAGAANASAIDVHEFGFSLSAAGAVAATVGLSFDDLAQGIAIMGQAGIKGSDAGTSLKTMLLNLQPQTDKQTSLFKELGLITANGANQFFDATGKIKSLANVSQTLQDALKGMTEQQKLATLETLFGSDAIRASAVLAKAGAAGFDEMAAAMGKVSAQDVANERLNNLQGSLEKLKGSLETAAIGIGSAFLPALKDMTDAATTAVNDAMPQMTDAANAMAAAFVAALPSITEFFRLMVDNGDTIKTVAVALAALAIIVTVTGWITGAIAAFSALSATVAASGSILVGIVAILGGPVTLIVAAVVALVVGLGLAWATNFLGIRDITSAVVTAVIGFFTNLAANLQLISDAMVAWLNTTSVGITTWLTTVSTFWITTWTTIQTFMQSFFDLVGQIILLGLGIWYTLFVQPFIDLTNLFIDTFTAIATWLDTTFWQPVAALFTNAVANLQNNILTPAWTAIQTKVTEIWGAISSWLIDQLWTPLSGKATEIFDGMRGSIEGIWNAIKSKAEEIWNGLKGALEGIYDSMKGGAESRIGSLRDGVLSIFGDLATKAKDAGTKFLEQFLSGLKAKGKDVLDYVSGLAGDILKKLKSVLKVDSPSKELFDIGANAGEGLRLGLESKVGDIKSTMATIGGAISGTAVNLPGNVTDWLNEAIRITGVDPSWLPGLLRLVSVESSGNPQAYNPTPVSNGEHAQGLLQTIPSTFASNMLSGYGNILNPVDNAIAAIRYIQKRYGSVYNTPLFDTGPGGYLGYAKGGIVPGWAGQPQLAMLHGGEMVLTPAQQAALLHGSAGGGGLELHVHVNAPIYGVNDMESVIISALDRAERRGRF